MRPPATAPALSASRCARSVPLDAADGFVWHAATATLQPVPEIQRVPLGLLKGVDLVREQIDQALGERRMPYDVADHGLIVWPDGQYLDEARYHLHRKGSLRPSPRSVARTYDLVALNREELVFSHTPIPRNAWEARWAGGGQEATPLLPAAARWTFEVPGSEGSSAAASFRAS